jgi:hypothetical protein
MVQQDIVGLNVEMHNVCVATLVQVLEASPDANSNLKQRILADRLFSGLPRTVPFEGTVRHELVDVAPF